MIVYFSDRQMQVLGLASTNLHDGYVITEDLKTEEVETGVATFSCRIGFNDENRLALEGMTEAGNYLLRSHDGENEFYTIIETEIDTKNKTINIYAEDAGLDLLNEIAGEFEATESHTAEWYINKYILDSGFEIGINEIPESSVRKLKWEGEETVTARLASIATQFDGFEIAYSFDIKGLSITNKYVNIYKERGKDVGITLRLNQDIDKIITTKTVANLATAFVCEGGVPDNEEEPITLKGYTYDDGDFYVDENGTLKSRNAVAKWSRYVWNKEPNQLSGYEGHIVRPYSYNTTDQKTLCSHAITELKKICDMEVNYEIDIRKLPENVKIGDRINIVDDDGELYVSTRILMLEESVVDQSHEATLGEHLIKTSGISQKVIDLAEQFAKTSVSAARALSVASTAKTIADAAKTQADEAAEEAGNAQAVANEAKSAAGNATASANDAVAKANAAQEAVSGVVETVSEMEKVVDEAEQLAEGAKSAADSANAKSDEAKAAAESAAANASEAKTSASEAKTTAQSAVAKAEAAATNANTAKTTAEAASTVAEAAKLDAEQAQKDVDEWAENLETYKKTVTETYARKTDLTETSATLQSQITANANQLSITHSKVLVVDETANNAKELAEAAQTAADNAQAKADQATADAESAQDAADKAKAAADAAQADADNAKAAADAAQGVADRAEADLATAKANLATVTGRVDATEEEIAAAQAAVEAAQAAADAAQADATSAAQKATTAQNTASTAVTNAAAAQSAADNAASKATLAQKAADEAKGDASAAQSTANEAKTNAAAAQATANTAVANAATAQAKADQAALEAANAQDAADEADAKAAQAQTDLNAAKQNLANVTSRVGATEAEIAEAQEAVVAAQQAADKAKADAATAQSTANTAKANAATAQTAANNAKTAADNAKKAADDAQAAADKAQDDVDSLAVRVTTAETNITQNSEAIKLTATKTEVAEMLGGYYTKEEADAAIEVSANSVKTTVSNTYATKSALATTDTKAANAQTAANNAKTAADNAQDDVDALSQTVETNYATKSEVTQTANSITSTVSATYATKGDLNGLKGRVDTVEKTKIGGRNLLPDTDFDGVSKRHEMVSGGATEGGFRFTPIIQVESGTEYTLSAKIRGKANINFYQLNTGGNQSAAWINRDDLSETDYKQFSITFTVAENRVFNQAYICTRYGDANTLVGDWFEIAPSSLKLEKGNKATDWTPAPEDMATTDALKAAESKITQNASSIAANVTEISGLKSRTSSLELTASSITSRVSAVENTKIGGKNLLPKSTNFTVSSCATGVISSISNDGYAVFVAASGNSGWAIFSVGTPSAVEDSLSEGDVFTISFEMRSADSATPPEIYIKNGLGYYRLKGSLSSNWSKVWYAGTWKDANTIQTIFNFGGLAGTFEVKNCKIEKGNKPTDWTPAIEDMASGEDLNDMGESIGDAVDRIGTAESAIQQLLDSISMLVTDGNGTSLMTQTANGWTFSTGALQGAVDKASENLGILQTEMGDANSAIEVLDAAVKDLGVLAEYIKIGTYTYTDENGTVQTEPSIDLGEHDTGFKLKITNTRILFTDGSSELVTINSKNKSLEIGKATIKSDLQFGDEEDNQIPGVWIWKQRANGNLGLMWKGVNE